MTATIKIDAFNSHNSQFRADHNKKYGFCPAATITKKDEGAYSRAMEKAAIAKRNVKVSLPPMPW